MANACVLNMVCFVALLIFYVHPTMTRTSKRQTNIIDRAWTLSSLSIEMCMLFVDLVLCEMKKTEWKKKRNRNTRTASKSHLCNLIRVSKIDRTNVHRTATTKRQRRQKQIMTRTVAGGSSGSSLTQNNEVVVLHTYVSVLCIVECALSWS